MNWQNVSAIAEVVIALGLILNLLQMRSDHERSRREKAIDLIFRWAAEKEQKADAARKLGDALDFQQSRCIHQQLSVEISAKHRSLLEMVLDSPLDETDGEILINPKQSSEIRFYIVRYLNAIEGVMSAWRHNVADRDIIDEEFRNFVSHENREYILENYRQAAGGKHAYPALAQFVRQVRDDDERADRGSKKKIM